MENSQMTTNNQAPDFHALCAELATTLAERIDDKGDTGPHYCHAAGLLTRARAALAQSYPEGPSESDISELFYRHIGEGSEVGFENAIEEALARWGRN